MSARFTMKLERRPTSASRITANVQQQVKVSYTSLAKDIVKDVRAKFAYFSKPPTFRYYVRISNVRYAIEITLPLDSFSNKKAKWINDGTQPHIITGRNGNRLFFKLPATIQTIPADGNVAKSVTGDPGRYAPFSVEHPGISPRYFIQDAVNKYKGRRPGSFYNVTEAAIKRGIRRDIKEQ